MIAKLKRREFITLLGGAAAAWPPRGTRAAPCDITVCRWQGRSRPVLSFMLIPHRGAGEAVTWTPIVAEGSEAVVGQQRRHHPTFNPSLEDRGDSTNYRKLAEHKLGRVS